ncbi:uncharacterized protein PG998_014083 [Apiospora kogelbergensis]|uniref:uncharacterized protein n=1 Tax=Apiospora kogelbergensis TaxID=1337665 RepID=UPI00312F77AF
MQITESIDVVTLPPLLAGAIAAKEGDAAPGNSASLKRGGLYEPWQALAAAKLAEGCGSVKTPGGGFWSHVRQCSLAAVVDSLAFLAAAAAPSDGGESQGPNPHRAGGDEPWNAW